MKTYISILRGINVSGHRMIKMDALRSMYSNMGFHNIRTYVQSGNVIFRSEESSVHLLKSKISENIMTEFGFDVPVIILTMEKLKSIIENNPHTIDNCKNSDFFHVTFLSSEPEEVDVKTIESKKQAGEEIYLSGDVIYLYCPNGYGNTKLNNNFLESRLKVGATTRNWKSSLALLEIATNIDI